MLKRVLACAVSALLLVLIGCASNSAKDDANFSGTSEALQHDLDLARLQDLKALSGTIEKYQQQTGKYPFEGLADVPVYVHIATREQQRFAKAGPPYEHKKVAAKEFVTVLQSALGDIEIPFDLQHVPVNKPNFYIYKIVDDTYHLAVHVHNDYSFANKVANFYHKVEVTNKSVGGGAWLRTDLLAHPEFNAALKAQPYKPGYTESLRVKLGGNSAF